MASGWTNKGLYNLLNVGFRDAAQETNMYIALVTSATTPDADTNTMSQLTEIAAGNGYTTGGYSLTTNSTDFDVLTEDDGNNRAHMEIKNVTWTASGGSVPSSGSGARYAVLTDDHATVSSREIWAYFDLSSDRSASVGQTITLSDSILRLSN